MFGLMRYAGSCLAPEAKRVRQTQYCGTCKTMGRLFGQSARATLNHDAVFLGELLLALQPGALTDRAFTPRRCHALPRAEAIPPALAYAAAANVVLTEFAITDQLLDGDRRWWPVKAALSRSFRAARAHLRAAGLPLETLFAQQQRQAERERGRAGSLDFFAEPTGTATGLVFAHGAPAFTAPLGAMGEAFGRLVYVLDAIQDQADDTRWGAFNALSASKTPLPEARRYVRAQQRLFQEALDTLPLAPATGEGFRLRLRASVNQALMSTQLPQDQQTVLTRPASKRRRPRPDNQSRCGSCVSDCADTLCCLSCSDDACCCAVNACESCGCTGCEGCCAGSDCCAGCDCCAGSSCC